VSSAEDGAGMGPWALMEEIREHLADTPELVGEGGLVVAELEHAPNVSIALPGLVVGPPTWTLHTPVVGGVADYTLTVWVVVAVGKDSFRQLMEYAPRVMAALDGPPGIAVKGARPTTFPGGSVDLPAYGIDIEVTA
jgi:hypothetical protein